jgi:hypothetical protein
VSARCARCHQEARPLRRWSPPELGGFHVKLCSPCYERAETFRLESNATVWHREDGGRTVAWKRAEVLTS